MSDFFRTRMGHTFFEGTMPRFVEELARLNNLLERALTLAERALDRVEARDDERGES